MSTTLKTTASDEEARRYALLALETQEFEVLTTLDPTGKDWGTERVSAHIHTVDPVGTLEFWVIDGYDAWNLVRSIPKGWYGPWSVVAVEPPAEDMTVDPAPEDFGVTDVSPPKKLKDVWEGKGDPDPDGLGVVAKPVDEDDPERFVPEYDYDTWIEKQDAADDRRIEALRKASDFQFVPLTEEEIRRSRLPGGASLSHLKPSESDEVVPQAVGLPKPPYNRENLPYTTLVGFDGVPLDSDVPDAVKVYANKVVRKSNQELVEDWHGRVPPS